MINRKSLISLLGVALVATALPASALAQEEPEVTPEGVVWTLSATGGNPVPAGVEATLFMEDGQANGTTGCNSFSGTYQLDGENLTFDENFAVTQAFCEGAPGEVEQAVLAGLPQVATWSIEGAVLDLADASGATVLSYTEPIVDVTETDVIALLAELERLDGRISNTRQDVRDLDVDGLRDRVVASEAVLEEVSRRVTNQNVPGLRDRVIANEAVLKELTDRFVNVRARVRDLERRVSALERAVFEAVPGDE